MNVVSGRVWEHRRRLADLRNFLLGFVEGALHPQLATTFRFPLGLLVGAFRPSKNTLM